MTSKQIDAIILIIFKMSMRLFTAFILFMLVYAISMGILNDICGCAKDYDLTNLWR